MSNRDGRDRCSSGRHRQYGVETDGVDQEILSQMIERATAFMPRLARLQAIRAWTGFRAATPDKLPLIGRCAEDANLFLATGHEGLGITTSLATARIVVDELLGRDSAIPREPYSRHVLVTRSVTPEAFRRRDHMMYGIEMIAHTR